MKIVGLCNFPIILMSTSPSIRSYKDLIVWQKSMNLVTSIYELSAHLPKEELYGLTAQMRRSAVAIPSLIAEGWNKAAKQDYTQLLKQARSIGAKLETQIEIVKNLKSTKSANYSSSEELLTEVMKMLFVMTKNRSAKKVVEEPTEGAKDEEAKDEVSV